MNAGMRFIALVSGGKDSIYSVMRCMQLGHDCCCLANLHPPATAQSDECDSFTFQTVGCGAVEHVAKAMQLSLVRAPLHGGCVRSTCEYEATAGDEVEDLLRLIEECMKLYPDAQAVSCGAVLSDYQRLRVENVCRRLQLTCLAPLWRIPQQLLVESMLADGVDAIIVKASVCAHSEQRLSAVPLMFLRLPLRVCRSTFSGADCLKYIRRSLSLRSSTGCTSQARVASTSQTNQCQFFATAAHILHFQIREHLHRRADIRVALDAALQRRAPNSVGQVRSCRAS
jgi:diphthine-ammonia ligase